MGRHELSQSVTFVIVQSQDSLEVKAWPKEGGADQGPDVSQAAAAANWEEVYTPLSVAVGANERE